MSQSQGIEVRRPSRRTIAAGAAWAVPVIAIGAAAPRVSASPPEIDFELDPLASCKYPGQSVDGYEYGYDMAFTVTSTVTGALCITDVATPGNTPDEVDIISVEPGATNCVAIVPGENEIRIIVGAQNSANGTATFTYTFSGVAGTFLATISNFHPCDRED